MLEQTMTDEELIRKIETADRRYWEEGSPEISDAAYDELIRELARRKPDHPLLSSVHAPAAVGEGKVKHDPPMLSLDKAYSLPEVRSWADKYIRSPEETLLIQPKYDGISACWDGTILSTRGDGFIGENITGKLPLIELESPSFRAPLREWTGGEVMGEIVIREDDFRNLYSHIINRNGVLYKNSRNAVAGIMGLKEIGDMIRQKAKLTLVDYNLYSVPVPARELETRWEELVRQMRALPYPMDGIVIRIADEAYAGSLGSTVHHPRGRIAFKFGDGLKRKTRLTNVIWSFGKNCLTPLAEFEPVEIGGTTIRRATLHNLQNVLTRDIRIGDVVTVARAGDVIPYIESSEPGDTRTNAVIDRCPSCGSLLVQELPELRCVNPACPETCIQLLLAAVSVFGIDGLGEAKIRDMVKILHLKQIGDLFNLGSMELQQLPGVKSVAANKLYRQIQNARNVPDWKILASLNIRGIGGNLAKQILQEIPFSELRSAGPERLASLRGVGPERAGILCAELKRQSAYIDSLLAVRSSPEPDGDLFSF